ncbi:hypothetical protein PPTG_22196 [Phytophthora nicotianae INRA-310]|uniref:Uncharacterized protein n=1 Tax=Phytophthora nicotianae (strain INRA-310) TaxID=761204 RepID=W2QNN1_PHYN3|nr:hypothetical protein PPTG_22196 [Phytophthora nicotianae INRA-310]ETN14114.1 hypothetical protein PPTG_22196 [Phytophthora nicotianae INRA-310]
MLRNSFKVVIPKISGCSFSPFPINGNPSSSSMFSNTKAVSGSVSAKYAFVRTSSRTRKIEFFSILEASVYIGHYAEPGCMKDSLALVSGHQVLAVGCSKLDEVEQRFHPSDE